MPTNQPTTADIGGNIDVRALTGPNAAMTHKFIAKNPAVKPHFDHFQETSVLSDTLRNAAKGRINELENDQIRIFEKIRQAEKTAKQTVEDPDGKPKSDDADLKAARQEYEDHKAMIEAAKRERDSYPISQAPFLHDWMVGNVNRDFASVDMDKSKSDEKIADLTEAYKTEQVELRAIESANKTDAEVKEIVRAKFNTLRASPLSKITFDSILAGGSVDREGNFSLANDPRFHLPLEQYFSEFTLSAEGKPISGSIATLLPDLFAVLVGVDHDGWFESRFVAAALVQNKGKRQIAMTDKPRLIAAQKEKVLIAARRLEAGYRRVEASGKRIGRPREWSPMVMLWLARKTASDADRTMFG